MRNTVLVLAAVLMTAGATAAKPPLRDVAQVDDAVFDVAIADTIRKNCPDIAPRMIRAYALYRETRQLALSLGYTDAEIEAYGELGHREGPPARQGRGVFAQQWGCSLRPAKLLRIRAQRD